MQEINKSFKTEELVVWYQSTQNEDYFREIICRNDGLLHKWAWEYINIPAHDIEDLLEEGYIACWQAVKGYNIERGVCFSTFLKVTVRQHYNRLYKEATRQKRFTGSAPTSWEELEEINQEGAFTDDYTDIEVSEFLERLEGTTKKVADMLFTGVSKGDIAKALNITPASTSYHVKRLQQAYISYREAV